MKLKKKDTNTKILSILKAGNLTKKRNRHVTRLFIQLYQELGLTISATQYKKKLRRL